MIRPTILGYGTMPRQASFSEAIPPPLNFLLWETLCLLVLIMWTLGQATIDRWPLSTEVDPARKKPWNPKGLNVNADSDVNVN